MSTIVQRISFVIAIGGLFVFIWWLCAVTNIPFDASNPLNGAQGICDVTGWDGPSAVYTCTEAQRELALEVAQTRFNVYAGIMSTLFTLGITLLFMEGTASVNRQIRYAQSLPSNRTRNRRRPSSHRNQRTADSKVEPVSAMIEMDLIPKPSSRDKR